MSFPSGNVPGKGDRWKGVVGSVCGFLVVHTARDIRV